MRQNIARPIKRPEGSIISHNSSLKPSGRCLQKQKYLQPHADALADGMYCEKVAHTLEGIELSGRRGPTWQAARFPHAWGLAPALPQVAEANTPQASDVIQY